MKGPAAAVKALPSVLSIDSPPRPAGELLIEISLSQGWFATRTEAAEAAQRWERRFWERLRKLSNEYNAAGRLCVHAFNSSSPYMVQGAAFIETGVDSPELQEAKRRRARYTSYLDALKRLTPSEFEVMCRGIIGLFGVEDPQLSPSSGDEGIDFFGSLRLESLRDKVDALPDVYRRLNAWMIGQAKHYQSTQVATPDIRDLVGAVELARGRAFGSASPRYENLQILVCDPVFYLFFTTGTISADGWRLLEKSGVIAMDGEMVAAFLADQQVGLRSGSFSDAALDAWIAQLGADA